jgi:hypothetical protein
MNQQTLKQLLHYDSSTGHFTWLVSTAKRITVGNRAGSSHNKGYRVIKIDGKAYKEHRLAWLYIHGVFPNDCLDHINGVRHDNRIDNLREATNAENSQNRSKMKNNASGFIGVVWHKGANKWSSQIYKDGEKNYLGLFSTPESAHEAYVKAKSELHTFQPEPRL